MIRKLIAAAIILLLTGLYCLPDIQLYLLRGQELVPVSLMNLHKREVTLPQPEKKISFLLWSLDNPASLKTLLKIQNKISHGTVSVDAFYAVNIDAASRKNEVVDFIDKNEIICLFLLDPDKKLISQLKLEIVPSLYTHSRDGVIEAATRHF